MNSIRTQEEVRSLAKVRRKLLIGGKSLQVADGDYTYFHSGGISKIKYDEENDLLFTASKDSTIAVYFI